MANRRSSRSDKKGDDALVTYGIATPFNIHDVTIYLFQAGHDAIEVLIGHVPEPYMYHDNAETDDTAHLDNQSIARWILEQAAQPLEKWGYDTSDYKTNNPNYHLRDVYFECPRAEVNEAVLAAKEFVRALEAAVVRHRERAGAGLPRSPQQDLAEATE